MMHVTSGRKCALAIAAAACVHSAAALAQSTESTATINEIIVTAQRIEQRLQDVPMSITVFDQRQLAENNVTNMKDLATYTPGLHVNSRYGSDSTNFSIRGFTQEQRTYATVGTYFAEVVAPRGSGATFGGDGAGPGALFDLQNVQVLKGPQGTLFGRNVTGGAVLLVPRKPTDSLEGYVEADAGSYDMRRMQAVANVPLADTVRMRVGVDRMVREGFLRNIGELGDGAHGSEHMGNVDYWAGRLSVVADVTANLENYTIATYSRTRSNGVIPKILECFPGVNAASAIGQLPFGNYCVAQAAREAESDKWTVSNRLPNSRSDTDQWQVINTLQWKASDTLNVKNILAYGEYRGTTNLDLFGTYFIHDRFGRNPNTTVTSGNQVSGFAFTSAEPFSGDTNAQSSFVAELQLQGLPNGGRFSWQGGIYAELNDPLGFSGVQTATLAACENIATLNCLFGSATLQRSKTRFRDYAAYAQGSYDVTERIKLTGGIRYTEDKQSSVIDIATISIPVNNPTDFPPGATASCSNRSAFSGDELLPFPASERKGRCLQHLRNKTSAPTWMVNAEYRPLEDMMLYAKYTRGYRQGGLSLFSPDTTQAFDEESVDVYEIGTKTSWGGAVPGSFNLAGFYNKFKDQQLLLGVTSSRGLAPPSASIVNAGRSYMKGIETDLTLRLFDDLDLSISYAYLKTKLQEFVTPAFASGSLYDRVTPPLVGDSIPNSIPHKVNVTAGYRLPLPEQIGEVTLGTTYVYTSRYRSVAPACPTSTTPGCVIAANPAANPPTAAVPFANPDGGMIPASHVINLHLTIENVAQMPIDAAFFVTNLTNELVILNANDNTPRGFLSGLLGEPRMYGFRLKYRFGN